MEWIRVVTKAAGLDSTSEDVWLVAAVVALVLWWIYNNAQKQAKDEQERLRENYQALFSPALGLIEGYHSGRVSKDAFKERFADLLINERARATSQLAEAMERWIKGADNAYELEYLLQNACGAAVKRLRHTGSFTVRHAFWWLMDTYLNVALSAGALLLFIGACWVLALFFVHAPNGLRLGSIALGIVGIVLYKYSRTKRQQESLDRGIAEIRRRREKR